MTIEIGSIAIDSSSEESGSPYMPAMIVADVPPEDTPDPEVPPRSLGLIDSSSQVFHSDFNTSSSADSDWLPQTIDEDEDHSGSRNTANIDQGVIPTRSGGTIVAQSDSMSISSDTTILAEDPVASARRRLRQRQRSRIYRSFVNFCFRILWIPLILALLIILGAFILIFGVLPLLLLIIAIFISYYCCTSQPIPPRVLIRALFSDADLNANSQPVQYTTEQIQQSLITRYCLMRTPADSIDNSKLHEVIPLVSAETQTRDSFVCYQESSWMWILSKPISHKGQEVSIELADFDAPAIDHINHLTREAETDHQSNHSRQSGVEEEEKTEEIVLDIKEEVSSSHQTCSEIPVDPHAPLEDVVSTCSGQWSDCSIEGEPSHRQQNNAMHAKEDEWGCDICLGEFEQLDAISWSRNVNCPHHFHRDCIVDWLLRKANCPSCRQPYVCLGDVEIGSPP